MALVEDISPYDHVIDLGRDDFDTMYGDIMKREIDPVSACGASEISPVCQFHLTILEQ
jgi:hypothetical protein